MRREELVAGGDLAAVGVAGVTRHIHELHSGISQRVFSALGEAAEPVRVVHDGIAGVAYGSTRVLAGGAIRAGARVAGALRPDDAPPLDRSTRARLVVGALNGAWGDTLERRGNPLAAAMTVRMRGDAVALSTSSLAAAFPAATPRLAVFLHGLCETEDGWRLHADRARPYGERLAAELGYTPVYLRYNSGRHISDNGRSLAALLDELVAAWPIAVGEIALIGHSMGGLIARSACHYGAGRDAVARVRQIVALGAPHHGAQLERAAHAAGAALRRLPETRALSTALGSRSVGIRDLYHGYLVDEDWENFDPDEFFVAAAREIPFLDTATHYFVAATLTRDSEAPLGRAFGDLLVSRPSAWKQRRNERLRFPVDNYRHYGGATHFDLLNHPAIGDQLIDWLGSRPRELAAVAVAPEH
jgi:PGAP1-like protein